MDIAGKKVTIIGAQRSGIALARLVQRLQGHPKISEVKPIVELPQEVQEGIKKQQVTIETGGHTQLFIEDSDIVVLSPGVHFNSLPPQWAQAKGIPVLGEIEFAFQFCSKPVIAVTGSNGKTTVVTLIHEVLKEAGYRSVLCGNVGYPFSQYVLDLADKDFVVLEVSSFQMESLLDEDSPYRNSANGCLSLHGFKPFIAAFLNFSQNHLDRHKDLNEYFSGQKISNINQYGQLCKFGRLKTQSP